MNDIFLFVVKRLATKAFWMLVITSFVGVVMWELRWSFKRHIFQAAVTELKENRWKNFRGGKSW